MSPVVSKITPSSAARKAREIGAYLRNDAAKVIAYKQLFECGTMERMAEVNRFKEGYIANLIQAAAIAEIVLSVTKACDSAKRSMDRYSLPVARALLLDSDAFEIAAAPPGNSKDLSYFMNETEQLESAYWRDRVREFRDYRLAHHLPDAFATVDTPQIKHLWDGVEAVLQAIYHLSAGTGANLITYDSDWKFWSERSEAYWGRLMAGPPGRKMRS